jgi:dephospho-CoA kinase
VVEQSVVPLIGLTGGMGAGKSTALKALERLGAAVQSSDAVVHELYGGDKLREAVIARWGEEVLAPGGEVDRVAVARRAFADEQGRAWLEATVWPLVGERMGTWLEQARTLEPSPRAIAIEVPLLFEAGMEGIYDVTLAIVAAEPLRERRAAERGHALTAERAARQLSQEEKARRATYVIENDGSVDELERKLSGVLDKLGR